MSESQPQIPDLEVLLRDVEVAEAYVVSLHDFIDQQTNFFTQLYQWLADESQFPADNGTASQGLVWTGYEGDGTTQPPEVILLDQEIIKRTVHAWLYYLVLFNHPERIKHLFEQSEIPFQAPRRKSNPVFFMARILRTALTISDIKLSAQGSQRDRVRRTQRLKEGPFVSYWRQRRGLFGMKEEGRKQARSLFAAGANPEITGSPMAIATLAQAHCLVCLPRDGYFHDIDRQVALAKETFEMLDCSPILVGRDQEDQTRLLDYYRHNVVGVVEANPGKAVERAIALYRAGVRTFRIYSPEPGNGPLKTLKALRTLEKNQGWEPIEIFVGQVVDVKQAKQLEKAGADAIYVGIGGGGRCITGVIGGLTIDWPQLVWRLRGQISIPVIVEGGANDAVPESILIGASGIGVVGKFAGTIETPGGAGFFTGEIGSEDLFRYYGGEASDRMRFMGGRAGPFGRIWNREGETRHKPLRNQPGSLPTLLEVLSVLQESAIAGMVFQGALTIADLQNNARSLRRESNTGSDNRHTH